MQANDFINNHKDNFVSAKDLFSIIEELLAEGHQAAFTITGMSMWPFLCHRRDQVVLESCSPETLKKRDIVLLQTTEGNYIVHRITKLTSDGFETTGDGLYYRDGFFPMSCLRARVVQLKRKGKVIDCNSLSWKIISILWTALFPFRKVIFTTWFFVRRFIKKD